MINTERFLDQSSTENFDYVKKSTVSSNSNFAKVNRVKIERVILKKLPKVEK